MAATTYSIEVFDGTGTAHVICNRCRESVFTAVGVHTKQEAWSQYLARQTGDFSCACTRQPGPESEAFTAGYRDAKDGFTPLVQADAACQFGGSIRGENPLYDSYLAGYNKFQA